MAEETTNPEVMYKLGRIESLIESQVKKLDEYITESKSQHTDHEGRIKTLEAKDIRHSAIAGTLGAITGFIGPIVLKALFHV